MMATSLLILSSLFVVLSLVAAVTTGEDDFTFQLKGNFPPTVRKPVELITARVGELLVYVVPEDSMYDPEDGSVRNLKLSLMMMDRSPIPPNYWLQFDVENQEFYGLPLPGEEGIMEYQLVCEDKEGLMAHAMLLVEVIPARDIPYSVEFSMTFEMFYDYFGSRAQIKRLFVEKVLELFGEDDRNVTSVTVSGVHPVDGGVRTVVSWHNQSLEVSSCPRVDDLRRVLLDDADGDGSFPSERVNLVMGSKFHVHYIQIVPLGACLGSFTLIETTEAEDVGDAFSFMDVNKTPMVPRAVLAHDDDDHLVHIMVLVMSVLVFAGIVIALLQRNVKMSVEGDDDPQDFPNKGIQYIIHDEQLDNKSPVIFIKDQENQHHDGDHRQGDVDASTI